MTDKPTDKSNILVNPADMVLTEEEKTELLNIQKLQTFSKGSILLRTGEPITQYYSVVTGCVRTYHLHDGEEFTLDFYTEGHTVMPAITTRGAVSPCFVVCEEECVLNTTDEEVENQAFERFPRLKDLCRTSTESLLIENQKDMARLKSYTPEQRYEHLLSTRPELINRVPQYQIASYLGIKPESLSRLRKRMFIRAVDSNIKVS